MSMQFRLAVIMTSLHAPHLVQQLIAIYHDSRPAAIIHRRMPALVALPDDLPSALTLAIAKHTPLHFSHRDRINIFFVTVAVLIVSYETAISSHPYSSIM